jgi:membrane protein implicated in regulation of membrane protease activity
MCGFTKLRFDTALKVECREQTRFNRVKPLQMKYIPEIWILIGFGLIVLEFFLPGAIVVFMGTSAVFVGLVLKLSPFPEGNGLPFLLFSILTIAQIALLRSRFKLSFKGDTVKDGANDLEEFIGHEATVHSGFEEGKRKGKVVFKGTQWTALSEDSLEPGDTVEIISRDGITLSVRKS